jgi:hypothetical protein
VEGELLVFNSKGGPLTGGAQLGFVWAVPGEKRFLILLSRVELSDVCAAKHHWRKREVWMQGGASWGIAAENGSTTFSECERDLRGCVWVLASPKVLKQDLYFTLSHLLLPVGVIIDWGTFFCRAWLSFPLNFKVWRRAVNNKSALSSPLQA